MDTLGLIWNSTPGWKVSWTPLAQSVLGWPPA